MPSGKVPNILMIDDRCSEVEGLANLIENEDLAKVAICEPGKVDRLAVLNADLVLVDYDIAEWRDGTQLGEIISKRPGNGLALVPVLKSHIMKDKAQPIAYAILTGKMDELAKPLPPDYRNYALASLNNLEWIFEKSAHRDDAPLYRQIAQLASAVKRLPRGWISDSDGGSIQQLAELLALQMGSDESDEIMQDVLSCHPPLYELSEWSHGLTILRWLLHRILPYPCFLLDTRYLAARLRVEYSSLEAAIKPGNPLHKALSSCQYDGILPTFLGPRWWRTGINLFLSHITKGNASNVTAVRDAINALAKQELPPSVPTDYPIVCIDQNYEPLDELYSIDESLRIRPDDWPAYADQAWTPIIVAKEDPKLQAIVIEEDKGRLG